MSSERDVASALDIVKFREGNSLYTFKYVNIIAVRRWTKYLKANICGVFDQPQIGSTYGHWQLPISLLKCILLGT
jgi:hypothetical protein